MTEKEIYLDLDRSRDAAAFEEGQSFWEEEISALTDAVTRHRDQLRDYEKQAPKESRDGQRPKAALVILGGRGSGKSSLLKSFLARLSDESAEASEAEARRSSRDEHLQPGVFVLKELDPTILSSRDQFLYAVLASLLDQLEDRQDRDGAVFPGDLRSTHSFRRLARHLRAVDPKPPESEQPIVQSMEQLDAHRSGPKLKQHIRRFLDDFASDLGSLGGPASKKVAVLPIDDPDMAFEHFYDILEQYRRYLHHPYLVPVFTFSEQLALRLLGEEYGGHFKRHLKRRDEQVWPEVGELSQQYLAKLFPTRQRVRLILPEDKLLRSFAGRGPRVVLDDGSEEGDEKRVRGQLKKTLKQLLDEENDTLVRTLLPPTLRQSIRLIDATYYTEKDEESSASEGAPSRSDDEMVVLPPELVRAVADVYSATLRSHGIEIEYLYALSSERRGTELLKRFLESSEEGVQRLVPTWFEGHLRRDAMVISLLAAEAFEPAVLSATRVRGSSRLFPSVAFLWAMRLTMGFYLPVVDEYRRRSRDPVAPQWREARLSEGGQPEERGLPERSRRSLVDREEDLSVSTFLHQTVRAGGHGHGSLRVHAGGRVSLRQGDARLVPGDFSGARGRPYWKGYSVEAWNDALHDKRPLRAETEELPVPLGLGELMGLAGPRLRLLLEIWTQYGEEGGGLWSSFSLWRGLSLVVDILSETRSAKSEECKDLVRKLLMAHLQRRSVGSAAGAGDSESHGAVMPRRSWEAYPDSELARRERKRWDNQVEALVGLLDDWWRRFSEERVKARKVRRLLRGDYIVGHFFRELEERRAGIPEHRWAPGMAMTTWLESLVPYIEHAFGEDGRGNENWADESRADPNEGPSGGQRKVGDRESKEWMLRLIQECPIFFPFFQENQERGRLPFPEAEAESDAERREPSDGLELRILRDGTEQLDFFHELTLEEVLDAVIPSPYEGYFRRFRERVRGYKRPTEDLI